MRPLTSRGIPSPTAVDWETGYGPCPNSTAQCAAPASWFADFDRPLGPPLGPPTVSGTVWTRSFESACVFVDLANRSLCSITWLSASSSQTTTPSESGSPSETQTQTSSQKATQTRTCTPSETLTQSGTQRVTRSRTATPTMSPSGTQGSTQSRSSSESPTLTQSVTGSQSNSSLSHSLLPPAQPAVSDSAAVSRGGLSPGGLAASVVVPICAVLIAAAIVWIVVLRRRRLRRFPVATCAPYSGAPAASTASDCAIVYDGSVVQGANPIRASRAIAESTRA